MPDAPDNPPRWLIIADDRTGAADCAIPFANRGLQTTVGWHHENSPETQTHVYSHDADTRHLPAEQAAEKYAAAVKTFLPGRTAFFKKIDSALRGQPAAQIAATLVLFRQIHGRAFAILAPAFPAMGRTTHNGHVFLHEKPLEETDLFHRDHTYPTGDLQTMLASANLSAEKIPLDQIRQGPAPLRKTLAQIQSRNISVAIADALEQSDLDTIAAAASGIGVPPMQHGQDAHATFFIGTAGLAHALAATIPEQPPAPPPQIPDPRGTLIVVGSFAPESRASAQILSTAPSVKTFSVSPQSLLHHASTHTAPIIESLKNSHDALVLITADHPPDPSLHAPIAKALADLLAPTAPHISSLIATGGQTAAALFHAFQITAIRLIEEIDPGIPLGLSLRKIQIPVVTKAGAFGNDQSLLQILHRLRELRQIRCHP